MKPSGVLGRVVLLLVVATAGIIGAAAPSHAQTYPSVPTLTVDKATVTPCEKANLTGTGFLPNTTVTISADGTVIGTVMTDSSGNFTFPYMVSCTAVSGQITFTATDGVNTLSATVTVSSSATSGGSGTTGAGTSGTSAGSTSGTLTTTGAYVEPLIRAAVLLIAAGGLLLLALRRRELSV